MIHAQTKYNCMCGMELEDTSLITLQPLLIMKSTKVQTLGGIWRKYWNIWIENTLASYVLGDCTSKKNESDFDIFQ